MTKIELFKRLDAEESTDFRFQPKYDGDRAGREIFVAVGPQENGPQGLWVFDDTHKLMENVSDVQQWLEEYCSGWIVK